MTDDDGLTSDLANALVEAIEVECMPRKFAALFNGVSPKTLERWIAMGATGTGSALHTSFARRIFRTEGSKVGRVMGNMERLAAVDCKAGESFLKLFKPGDFGGPRKEPDEFDGIERNQQRQDKLLASPPPRLRAKMAMHGWWQFPVEMTGEDRAALVAMQRRYRSAPLLPEAELPAAASERAEKAP